MRAVRTGDERFENLPGYSFDPHYLDDLNGYEGLRIHYLDEGGTGNQAGPKTFLCLHGEPTWSYLYRKMIPVFTEAGHRCIAPDLLGFGKSDKPADDLSYSFDFHRNMLLRLVRRLDLSNVVLVVQDWGGLLGLTLPMEMPTRFTGLLIMNTDFATGEEQLGAGFKAWRAYNNANPDLAVGRLIARGTPQMSDAEIGAYDAPFPDITYKAGVRQFPNLVPTNPDAPGATLSRRARDWWTHQWNGKSFMAVGMQDPVFGPATMARVRTRIRNCPPPYEVEEGGHFVQEFGDRIARAALLVL